MARLDDVPPSDWLTGPPPSHRGRAGGGALALRVLATLVLLSTVSRASQGQRVLVDPANPYATGVNVTMVLLLIVLPYWLASRIARSHRREMSDWLAREEAADACSGPVPG